MIEPNGVNTTLSQSKTESKQMESKQIEMNQSQMESKPNEIETKCDRI